MPEIAEIADAPETPEVTADAQDVKWDACEPAICDFFPGQCGDLDDGCGGIIKCDCGEFGSCKLLEGTCKCDHEQCSGACCGPEYICFQEACCLSDCEAKECGDGGCGLDCGECVENETCTDGQCGCTFEDCEGLCCNDGENCCEEQCCSQDCTDKECGYDCCQSCGQCDEGYQCIIDDDEGTAVCQPKCDELCAGKNCGFADPDCPCGEGDSECNDGNDCTDDVCVDLSCQFTDNEAECDDGNPCTGGDLCSEGDCAGELLPLEDLVVEDCLCAEDADCEPLEDGNLCNGTLFCNLEADLPVCAVDPATDLAVIGCDDEIACTEDTCVAETGCVHAPNDDLCVDQNPCIDSLCDLIEGCEPAYNTAPCDDGNACTEDDVCGMGACEGIALDCEDEFSCTDDSCDPASGCINFKNADNCLDDNPCTGDLCDPEHNEADLDGCRHFPDVEEGTCEADEDPCTVEACDWGLVACASTPKCDDGVPCTTDSCDPLNGDCSFEDVVCDDENECTTDSCDPVSGECLFDGSLMDDEECDDEDECTIDTRCSGGTCGTGDELACDDGNPCTTDSCSPETGCEYAPFDDGVCDDGNDCTSSDHCAGGVCTGTLQQGCDAEDYDHDGLSGDDDDCPYAFDPDNAPGACLPAPAGLPYARTVALSHNGSTSPWRRTHEPMELPLKNGIIDDSVIGYWKMDGNGLDSGLHGNHGTAGGDPNESAGPMPVPGGGMSFDGDDYALINDDPSQDVTDEFTIAMYIRPGSLGPEQVLAAKYDHTTGNREFQLGLPDGRIKFWWSEDGSEQSPGPVFSAGEIAAGNWHHIAMVFAAGDISFYIDGALDNTESTVSGPIYDGSAKLSLGFDYHQNGYGFVGDMDEVILFNRALCADEIAAYVGSGAPYGTHFAPGAQADFDDLRVTETPHAADPLQNGEAVKRSRIIGPRPHSDTECLLVEDDGTGADREDLCGVYGYWKLDGEAGNVIPGNPGMTFKTTVARGRFGEPKGALAFNGIDAKVTSGLVPSLPDGISSTIEAWVYFDTPLAEKTFVIGFEQQSSVKYLLELDSAAEQFGFRATSDDKAPCVALTSSAGLMGGWHHVAGRIDYQKQETALFIDGLLAAADEDCVPGNINVQYGREMHIGGSNYSLGAEYSGFFHGRIDDVVLHKAAKSDDYLFHRANPGVPKLRFLANTVVTDQDQTVDGKSFPSRQYTLYWGDETAAALTPLVGDGDGGACYGLLNECFGYAGWWRLNEGRDDVAMDWSAAKHNGKYIGDFEWAPGPEGLAFSNDYSEAYVTVPDASHLYLDNGTWEVAFVPGLDISGATPDTLRLLSKFASGYWDDYGIHLSKADGLLHFVVEPVLLWEQVGIAGDSGNWVQGDRYHAAALFGSGGMALYQDYIKQQIEGEHTGGLVGDGIPLIFGGDLDDDEYFDGLLDSYRFMNRALTPDEMLHFPLLSSEFDDSNWEFVDVDGDGVLDDGDFSGVEGDHPCTGGQLTLCDDNAPAEANADQEDDDSDGVGSVTDNCPDAWNPGQEDADDNGAGDACSPNLIDWDHDGIVGEEDECPYAYDPQNLDLDDDGHPDACEPLDGSLGQSMDLTLSQQGGVSAWQRTHEPVEVPLVNGFVDASLLAYWTLLNGNGTDSSIHGNNAIGLSGDSTDGAFGDAVSAVEFNSPGHHLEGPKINPDYLTVMLWVKVENLDGGGNVLASLWDAEGEEQSYWLGTTGSAPVFLVNHGVGSVLTTDGSFVFPTGKWVHVAGTYDGFHAMLFVNGKLVARERVHATPSPLPLQAVTGATLIGAEPKSALYDNYLEGTVDEIMIFNRALSAFEIETYHRSSRPYGDHFDIASQSDFDDLRVTETPHAGDPLQLPETMKRSRIIGPRHHSDSPCPASAADGDWTSRDDLCGVAGYWRMQGTNTVPDIAGIHQAINNQATHVTGRFGDETGALEFGPGTNLFVAASTDFHVDNLTIEAWVLPTTDDVGDGTHTILSTTEDCGYALYLLNGHVIFNYWLVGVGYDDISEELPVTAVGRWVHIAATYDGNDSTLYVDGVVEATKSIPGALGHCSQPLLIGDEPNNGQPSGTSNFLGAIDEVLVHSVAKSPDYIYHRANPGLPALRFLANTVAVDQDESEEGTSFPLRTYSLRWGSSAATAVAPHISSAGEGEECYGLLNECLGYAAWWRFNDGGRVKTIDSSNLKNTGVFVDPAKELSFAAGPESLAMELDGSTIYSLIPDSPSLQSPVDEITIEGLLKVVGWFNSPTSGQHAELAGRGFCDNGENSFSYRLAVFGNKEAQTPSGANDNVCAFVQQSNGPVHHCSATGSFLAQNGWQALRASLAADGGLVGTDDDLAEIPGIDALQHQADKFSALGAKSVGCAAGGGALFTGAIDSIRIMSRALTEDEFLHYPLLEWWL